MHLLLPALIALSLVACDGQSGADEPDGTASPSETGAPSAPGALDDTGAPDAPDIAIGGGFGQFEPEWRANGQFGEEDTGRVDETAEPDDTGDTGDASGAAPD